MLMQPVGTPKFRMPYVSDACPSPPRASPPREREDSVKRKAMMMHCRLGCVACREKLQLARKAQAAARSPSKVDRSPSPCDGQLKESQCPVWPARCFEAEYIPDAIGDRPRGRHGGNWPSTPTRGGGHDLKQKHGGHDLHPRLFSVQMSVGSRTRSRERRRSRQRPIKGTPTSCKTTSNSKRWRADLYGDTSTQTSQDEPHPELSPDMPKRQLRLPSSLPYMKDLTNGFCASFSDPVNSRRTSGELLGHRLPSWTEVFARCGSRWEPEAPPSTASTNAAPTPGDSTPTAYSPRKLKFVNVEECLHFLRTPAPFRLQNGSARPRQFTTVEECMEFLKIPAEFPSLTSLPGVKREGPEEANPSASPEQAEAARRTEEAAKEAGRIVALQREKFHSQVTWALAVLECKHDDDATANNDPAIVQRCFRGLMRKLHPDRVGHASEVALAAELVREAKAIAQRHMSEVERPGLPRNFQASTLCSEPGQRRIKLQWSPPEDQTRAPVRRYVVRVVDPICGRPLTVAALEPDYFEEQKRFVSVEELGSYVLAEQELQKMPGLWKQSTVTMQVAAANEAGTSPWAVLQLPLTASSPLAVPTAAIRQQSPTPSPQCRSASASFHVGNGSAARAG